MLLEAPLLELAKFHYCLHQRLTPTPKLLISRFSRQRRRISSTVSTKPCAGKPERTFIIPHPDRLTGAPLHRHSAKLQQLLKLGLVSVFADFTNPTTVRLRSQRCIPKTIYSRSTDLTTMLQTSMASQCLILEMPTPVARCPSPPRTASSRRSTRSRARGPQTFLWHR